MLQVSTKAIRRRIVQYGLEEDTDFSAGSVSQLDHISQQFVTNLPHCGERSFDGRWVLRIQRHRLRRSLA